MTRTTMRLGRHLKVGDVIVYDETLLGQLKVAQIQGIQPAGRGWLRAELAGAGQMPIESGARYTVVAT